MCSRALASSVKIGSVRLIAMAAFPRERRYTISGGNLCQRYNCRNFAVGEGAVAAGRTAGSRAAIMAEVLQCHVFARPDFAMGGPHGGAPRGPIAGGLHGEAPPFAMGEPHRGGGAHGTR